VSSVVKVLLLRDLCGCSQRSLRFKALFRSA